MRRIVINLRNAGPVILTLVVVSFATTGGAAAQTIGTYSFTPETTCDTTTAVVSGSMLCANTILTETQITVDGLNIYVDVFFSSSIICLPALVPYEATATGPELTTPGTYFLTVRTFNNGVLSHTADSTLSVTQGESCGVPVVPSSWGAIKYIYKK